MGRRQFHRGRTVTGDQPRTAASPEGSGAGGRLLVVATPIGNLGDLTARAAEAFRQADIVAAEDTRRTRILLTHLGLSKHLVSFRSHNQAAQAAGLVKWMQEGKTLALATDAGVPGISDPGFLLVRQAAAAGVPVTSIPGPSALTVALSISGFPCDRFVFEGFLPMKKGRQRRLGELAAEPRTVVLFESPHRILSTLEALAALCPERPIMVAREMTKLHEEAVRGPTAVVHERLRSVPPRGEYTLVLGPAERPRERSEADSPKAGSPHSPP